MLTWENDMAWRCPISFVIRINKTSSEDIGYSLYLYFLGLSTRNIANIALSFLYIGKRSHIAIWKWIQNTNNNKKYRKKKKDYAIYNLWNPKSKSVHNTFGCGLQLKLKDIKFSYYLYLQRGEHTHRRMLSAKHCDRRLWKKVVSTEMEKHCIHRRLVGSWIWSITFILLWRQAWQKGQYNISRTRPKGLMTTLLVKGKIQFSSYQKLAQPICEYL